MPAASLDAPYDELAGKIAWAAEMRKGFDLFFVVANTKAAVDGFANALRRALPATAIVEMREEGRRLLSVLRDDVPTAANVLVTGFDAHAKEAEMPGSLFGGMNLDRDAIRALGKNLVLVLPSFALTLLAQAAPDFYDFRTVTLEVPLATDDVGLKPLAFGTSVLAASPEDRDRWISVLRSMESESNPQDQAERELTLAKLLGERGSYAEAEARLRAVLAQECEGGVSQDRLSVAYNDLGSTLLSLGRIEEAKTALTKAERLTREIFGDKDFPYAAVVANLGSVLSYENDFSGALAQYEKAERIVRTALGGDSPKVALILNSTGHAHQRMGNFGEALQAYGEAERIFRAAYGDDHPDVAVALSNIGASLELTGDFNGSLVQLRRAESILRSAYGDEHPYVAICLNNVGTTLHRQGDLGGALAAHREAERICRKSLGHSHPDLAIWIFNQGTVLKDQGNRKGALVAFERALLIAIEASVQMEVTVHQIARGIRSVGGDPIAIARKQIGEKAARKLKRALKEARSTK